MCSVQILLADVHAQKLWRNPKVWILACLVSGRQGEHGGGIPVSYISCELMGHSLQLNESCFRQVLFLKNFKFLKNLEIYIIVLTVSIGKDCLASWPNAFFT